MNLPKVCEQLRQGSDRVVGWGGGLEAPGELLDWLWLGFFQPLHLHPSVWNKHVYGH